MCNPVPRQLAFSYGSDFIMEPSFIFKLQVACLKLIPLSHGYHNLIRTLASLWLGT